MDTSVKRPPVSLFGSMGIAIIASTTGAFVASCALLGASAVKTEISALTLTIIPAVFLLVFLTSLVIAIPVSLVIGAPVVWLTQNQIVKWPILSAIALGVLGFLLGYPLEQYLDANSIQRCNDAYLYMLWGGVVGSAHAITLTWYRRRPIDIAKVAGSD